MSIPIKHEAAVTGLAATEAKAERAIRRLVKLSPKTKVKFDSMPATVQARAKPTGMGRGQGELTMNISRQVDLDKTPVKQVLTHERAHLAPKRNSQRFYERIQNPERRGREEGRADYLSGRSDYGGKPPRTHKERADAEAFSRGYAQVQRKMTRAGTKTQLNKRHSAFGVVW